MDLEKIINDFPYTIRQGYGEPGDSGYFGVKKFENIVICGMGGSALAGELFKLDVEQKKLDIKLPIYIHKNYDLPYFTTKNTFVIVISYSGNTEEAISSFEEALSQGIKMGVVTSGGTLKKLAEKNNIPLMLVPAGTVPPRFMIGWQLGAIMRLCSDARIMQELRRVQYAFMAGSNVSKSQFSPFYPNKDLKILAKKIKEKTLLIYSSEKNKILAYIFKIQLNETAKKQAFCNVFPELNHNEIMGFKEKNKNFSILLLKDETDHPRIKKRMQITENIIKKQGYVVDTIDIQTREWYAGIKYAMLLSYYIAKEKNIDPIKNDLIDALKSNL